MTYSSLAHDDWEMLIEMLGGVYELDRSARETGAMTRARNVKDGESKP